MKKHIDDIKSQFRCVNADFIRIHTVCPRSSGPILILVVTYNIKWVTTSWTYSTYGIFSNDSTLRFDLIEKK